MAVFCLRSSDNFPSYYIQKRHLHLLTSPLTLTAGACASDCVRCAALLPGVEELYCVQIVAWGEQRAANSARPLLAGAGGYEESRPRHRTVDPWHDPGRRERAMRAARSQSHEPGAVRSTRRSVLQCTRSEHEHARGRARVASVVAVAGGGAGGRGSFSIQPLTSIHHFHQIPHSAKAWPFGPAQPALRPPAVRRQPCWPASPPAPRPAPSRAGWRGSRSRCPPRPGG